VDDRPFEKCNFCNGSTDWRDISAQALADYSEDVRKQFKVILSDPYLMDGHLIVMTRRHVEIPTQLDYFESATLSRVASRMAERIYSGFAQGCDLRINYRPYKQHPDKMSHLHYHVEPRNPEDPLQLRSDKERWAMFQENRSNSPLTPEKVAELTGALFPGKPIAVPTSVA
jgi:diadenosine tetraphosphate (Ap4A) HIT family hydrolase